MSARLTGLLIAGVLLAQEQPDPITDKQRIAYREMERDYWQLQAQAATLARKIDAQHWIFLQACGASGFDEQALSCRETKKGN